MVANVGSSIVVGFRASSILIPEFGGAVDGVRIFTAGITTTVDLRDQRNTTRNNGDGGFEYPGDGILEGPAQYADNGSEQGLEVPGQASGS